MDEMDLTDLSVLVKQLAEIKAKQKELADKESSLKEQIMELMEQADSNSEATDYGTVRIQRRQEKDYGDAIREAEIHLKERKKLADDLGDYMVIGSKPSVVFNPPKDLF